MIKPGLISIVVPGPPTFIKLETGIQCVTLRYTVFENKNKEREITITCSGGKSVQILYLCKSNNNTLGKYSTPLRTNKSPAFKLLK